MTIAICDDKWYVQKELHGILERILEREQIPYELREFSSGEELLCQIEDIQLVFLDIQMPQLDGIEVGRQILERNPDCRIIIASGRRDRFKETYEIETLRFVTKPFNENEIWKAIQAYQRKYEIGQGEIEVFQNRIPFLIRQRQIRYVSAYKGGIEIMADNRLYHKEMSLNKVMEILDPICFYQVHKAYIVNFLHVTSYTDKEVVVGKIRIPLSKRSRAKFEKAYMDFDIRYR